MRRFTALVLSLLLGGCAVGPDYHGPPQDDFPATPEKFKGSPVHFGDARPADQTPRGQWWRIFHDSELDRLADLALGANQDLRQAAARISESRAQVRVALADFFPGAAFQGSASRSRSTDRGQYQKGKFLGDNPLGGLLGGAAAGGAGMGTGAMPGTGGAGAGAGTASGASSGPLVTLTQPLSTTQNLFRAPVQLNWEIDLFGRVRRNVEAARYSAEASVADYNNMALSVVANLAANYFMLRSYDAQINVLERTIVSRKSSLEISVKRLEAGVTDEIDVARARADLANNEAQLASTRRSRGELENSIATLVGQPASTLRLARRPTPERGAPPRVPTGIPSRMLERRPDVASAERTLASANAKIGVAVAAFFPQVSLTGTGGFESTDFGRLLQWPARMWMFGGNVNLPLFEGGRNLANLRDAQATFEENVAIYRGKVLAAFQDVETALVDLRTLATQAEAQDRSTDASRRALDLTEKKYLNGAIDYLNVLDTQRTLLQSELSSAQIVGQRLQSTVQLIKALGGDWR